jgi:FKBP-type peptidyl-prolyl cis-trans isomerase
MAPIRRIVRSARALGACAFTVLALGACADEAAPTDPARETYASALGVNVAEYTRLNQALYVKDLVVGTGAEAVAGRRIRAHYTGWLTNGQRFDSSVGGEPFETTIGVGQVIPGWDQGIPGMKVGGRRRLLVGSALGYGARASGPIPPNSTLVFEVELVSVQ